MVMMILLASRFEASLFNLNMAQKLVQTQLSRGDRTAGQEMFLQHSMIIFKTNYFFTVIYKFYSEIANSTVNNKTRRSAFHRCRIEDLNVKGNIYNSYSFGELRSCHLKKNTAN